MDLSEAVYYLLDLTVVLDWTAPPGATVADWLIGPAGVVTLHTEGVRLTGVAPVFATLTLPGDPPRWVWASLGEVVREIARLARAAAQQHGQDLRPVAFIRLLPASPLTEITGAPPHIEVPRVPQFCFVDESGANRAACASRRDDRGDVGTADFRSLTAIMRVRAAAYNRTNRIIIRHRRWCGGRRSVQDGQLRQHASLIRATHHGPTLACTMAERSTDIYTKEKRSAVMARVRAKNTAPELQVRSALHRLGYRFRLHRKELPGIPDIVLPKYRTVIFVHGCFWHQHPQCKKATLPKQNAAFWETKLARNAQRDIETTNALHGLGWRVVVLWECEIKAQGSSLADLLESVMREGTADE